MDNCKYFCMQSISSSRLKMGLPLLQYYGKWPFTRFLGIQEPASVLFSIANGYAHYIGYKKLNNFQSSQLRNYYMWFGIISMTLWTASTLFHSRDFPSTEKADYFMAIMGLEYSLFIAMIKAYKIKTFQIHAVLLIGGILYFGFHVFYLTFWPFDYTYNMIVGISLGILTNIHWLLWYYKYGSSTNYGLKQVAFVILITLAMSCEVFDFAPVFGILDAHALWHGLTVPLVYLHYSFLSSDLTHMEQGEKEWLVKNL